MADEPDLDDQDLDDIDEYDADDDGDVSIDAVAGRAGRDLDGVGSLQDTDAEQGDEAEVDDDFDLDSVAAREVGVDLDPVDDEDDEPVLD
jgi:hypothetical protein